MMVHRRLYGISVILIFVATVRSITQCPAKRTFKNYTCPRLFDPTERTRCCFWDGPACCLPGGFTCRDDATFFRNYCPGPNDGKNDKVCCTVNDDGKCCSDELVVGLISGFFGFVVVVALLVVFCWCWSSSKCPLNSYRRRRQMENTAAGVPTAEFPQWPPGYN